MSHQTRREPLPATYQFPTHDVECDCPDCRNRHCDHVPRFYNPLRDDFGCECGFARVLVDDLQRFKADLAVAEKAVRADMDRTLFTRRYDQKFEAPGYGHGV